MEESDIKLTIEDHISLGFKKNRRPYIKVDDSFQQSPDGFKGIIANVKATHAGRLTLNNMVYVPSRVIEGMNSFVNPYPRPIGAHHAKDRLQDEDPIGRVKKVAYVKTQTAQKFSRQFGDSVNIIEDSNRDIHDAVDVIRNIAKNPFFYDRSFEGFGYVLSSGFIPDYNDAKKIMDGRYLTASVKAGVSKAICSICDQDWGDSVCEHSLGEMVDGIRCFLITDKMVFKGYDYVNEPADELATHTNIHFVNSESEVLMPKYDSGDSIIYEISSPLVITDSVIDSDAFSKFLSEDKEQYSIDLSSIPKEVKVLAVDAKYNKLTVMTSPDRLDGHTHVAEVDLKGNGVTRDGNSPLFDHEHTVKEWMVEGYEDEESGYESYHRIWRDGGLMIASDNENKHDIDKSQESDTIKEVNNTVSEGVSLMTEKNKDNATKTEQRTLNDVLDSVMAEDLDLDSFSLTDEDRDLIYDGMTEFLAEDAKLSSEKRKGLPSSAFCGPDRSFPVNDCAHVTAARRLVGRYKGSGSKSKIKACIERKAKALGCDSEDSQTVDDSTDVNHLTDNFVITDQVTDETLQSSFSKIEKALINRNLKLDIRSGRIESLEKENKELQDSVSSRDEQLKYLRDELKFAYNDSVSINDAAIKADATLRQVLFDVINFHSKISSGDEVSQEELAKETVDSLYNKYQETFLKLDVEEISNKLNDGTTAVTDSTEVEDPTLKKNDTEETTTEQPQFSEFKQSVFDKAKDIFDSKGEMRTSTYLQSLVRNDIIELDFARKVVSVLRDGQKDS